MPRAATVNRMSTFRRWTRRCRDLGVEIRENARVEGLQIEGGKVVGVQTAMGVVAADMVICTVHAWTRAFMEQCETASAGQIVCPPAVCYVGTGVKPLRLPAINANPQGGYIRPARLGSNRFPPAGRR